VESVHEVRLNGKVLLKICVMLSLPSQTQALALTGTNITSGHTLLHLNHSFKRCYTANLGR
jgi:hypothetical protein